MAKSAAASRKAQRARRRKSDAELDSAIASLRAMCEEQDVQLGIATLNLLGRGDFMKRIGLTTIHSIVKKGLPVATKAIGKEFRLTKSGKVERVPVFHNVSQKLKARRTNRNKIKFVRRGA